MPGYRCQRTHFCDCCRNMGPLLDGVEGGKAFCERPFVLHRQQPEKDKQNVDFAPPCFSVKFPIFGLFFIFSCLFLQNNLASLVEREASLRA